MLELLAFKNADATKTLVTVLSLLLVIGLAAPSVATPYLAMTPANVLMVHYRMWTPFTAAYYETSPWIGPLSIAVIVSHCLSVAQYYLCSKSRLVAFKPSYVVH
jgi:hypothetical protein